MIKYTYKITEVKVYSNQQASNIVGEVRFELLAELNGETKKSFFPVEFDAPDYSKFTDYQNLTEQQIIDWVIAKIGQEQVDALKEGLQAQLEFVPPPDAPPILKPADLPWTQNN